MTLLPPTMPPVGACGRDQTPADRALDYTCIRPKGHSGPCALVYVSPAPIERPGLLAPDSGRRRFLQVLGVLAAAVIAAALGKACPAPRRARTQTGGR